MHSYVADINPLVVTSGTLSCHMASRKRVFEIMDQEAPRDNLQWYLQKDSQLYFNSRRLETAKTLGLTIDNRVKFDAHIKNRTQKAHLALQAMSWLQNTKAEITHKASRSLYTGMICPIFTCSSEVWHRPNKIQDYHIRYQLMTGVEYQALRKIIGAYYGSNHFTLAASVGIEPIERNLNNISVA